MLCSYNHLFFITICACFF